MVVLGRLTPLFSRWIFGSFQRVIERSKIPAIAAASSLRRVLTPGRLYGSDTPASAQGITTQPLHAASWSADSGASDAPKSTVREVTAAIPAPEPVGEYVRSIP